MDGVRRVHFFALHYNFHLNRQLFNKCRFRAHSGPIVGYFPLSNFIRFVFIHRYTFYDCICICIFVSFVLARANLFGNLWLLTN